MYSYTYRALQWNMENTAPPMDYLCPLDFTWSLLLTAGKPRCDWLGRSESFVELHFDSTSRCAKLSSSAQAHIWSVSEFRTARFHRAGS